MTEIEGIARLEFVRSDPEVPPISATEWHKRAEDEFVSYQFLRSVLNRDCTELVRLIEKSDDAKTWMRLVESFDELSDRLAAFSEAFESGSARLMVALARVATTEPDHRAGTPI